MREAIFRFCPKRHLTCYCVWRGEVIFPSSSQTHPCPRSRHGAIVYEGERLFFLSPPRLTLVPGAGMVLLCMKGRGYFSSLLPDLPLSQEQAWCYCVWRGEVIFPLSSQTHPCPRGRHGAIVYEGERLFFLPPPRLTLVPGMVLLCMKGRGYFSFLLPDSPLSQEQAWCYCVWRGEVIFPLSSQTHPCPRSRHGAIVYEGERLFFLSPPRLTLVPGAGMVLLCMKGRGYFSSLLPDLPLSQEQAWCYCVWRGEVIFPLSSQTHPCPRSRHGAIVYEGERLFFLSPPILTLVPGADMVLLCMKGRGYFSSLLPDLPLSQEQAWCYCVWRGEVIFPLPSQTYPCPRSRHGAIVYEGERLFFLSPPRLTLVPGAGMVLLCMKGKGYFSSLLPDLPLSQEQAWCYCVWRGEVIFPPSSQTHPCPRSRHGAIVYEGERLFFLPPPRLTLVPGAGMVLLCMKGRGYFSSLLPDLPLSQEQAWCYCVWRGEVIFPLSSQTHPCPRSRHGAIVYEGERLFFLSPPRLTLVPGAGMVLLCMKGRGYFSSLLPDSPLSQGQAWCYCVWRGEVIFPLSSQTHPCPRSRHGAIVYEGERLFFLSPPRLTLVPGAGMVLLCMKGRGYFSSLLPDSPLSQEQAWCYCVWRGEVIFPLSSQTYPCPRSRHGAIVYEGERLFFLSPPRLTLVPGAGMVLLCMKGRGYFSSLLPDLPLSQEQAWCYCVWRGEVIFPLSSQTHPCPRGRHGAIVYEGERLFFLSPPRLTLVPGAGMVLLCMKGRGYFSSLLPDSPLSQEQAWCYCVWRGEVIFPSSSQTHPCPRSRHGAIVYEGERLFFLSPPRLTLVPGMVLLCMKGRGYFSFLLPDSPLSQEQAWCYYVWRGEVIFPLSSQTHPCPRSRHGAIVYKGRVIFPLSSQTHPCPRSRHGAIVYEGERLFFLPPPRLTLVPGMVLLCMKGRGYFSSLLPDSPLSQEQAWCYCVWRGEVIFPLSSQTHPCPRHGAIVYEGERLFFLPPPRLTLVPGAGMVLLCMKGRGYFSSLLPDSPLSQGQAWCYCVWRGEVIFPLSSQTHPCPRSRHGAIVYEGERLFFLSPPRLTLVPGAGMVLLCMKGRGYFSSLLPDSPLSQEQAWCYCVWRGEVIFPLSSQTHPCPRHGAIVYEGERLFFLPPPRLTLVPGAGMVLLCMKGRGYFSSLLPDSPLSQGQAWCYCVWRGEVIFPLSSQTHPCPRHGAIVYEGERLFFLPPPRLTLVPGAGMVLLCMKGRGYFSSLLPDSPLSQGQAWCYCVWRGEVIFPLSSQTHPCPRSRHGAIVYEGERLFFLPPPRLTLVPGAGMVLLCMKGRGYFSSLLPDSPLSQGQAWCYCVWRGEVIFPSSSQTHPCPRSRHGAIVYEGERLFFLSPPRLTLVPGAGMVLLCMKGRGYFSSPLPDLPLSQGQAWCYCVWRGEVIFPLSSQTHPCPRGRHGAIVYEGERLFFLSPPRLTLVPGAGMVLLCIKGELFFLSPPRLTLVPGAGMVLLCMKGRGYFSSLLPDSPLSQEQAWCYCVWRGEVIFPLSSQTHPCPRSRHGAIVYEGERLFFLSPPRLTLVPGAGMVLLCMKGRGYFSSLLPDLPLSQEQAWCYCVWRGEVIFPLSSQTHPCPRGRHGAIVYEGERLFFLSPPRLTLVPGAGMVLLCMKGRGYFSSPLPDLPLSQGQAWCYCVWRGEVIFPLSSQTHPCPRHGAIVYEGERLFFLSPPRLTLVPGAGMVLLCMKGRGYFSSLLPDSPLSQGQAWCYCVWRGEVIFPLSSQTHPCPRSRHGAIVYEGERLFFLSPPRLTLVPGAGMVLLCMKGRGYFSFLLPDSPLSQEQTWCYCVWRGEVIFPLPFQTYPCPRSRHGAIVYEGERLFFLFPPILTLVPGMVLLCMKGGGYFSSLLPDLPLSQEQAWCYCVWRGEVIFPLSSQTHPCPRGRHGAIVYWGERLFFLSPPRLTLVPGACLMALWCWAGSVGTWYIAMAHYIWQDQRGPPTGAGCHV